MHLYHLLKLFPQNTRLPSLRAEGLIPYRLSAAGPQAGSGNTADNCCFCRSFCESEKELLIKVDFLSSAEEFTESDKLLLAPCLPAPSAPGLPWSSTLLVLCGGFG